MKRLIAGFALSVLSVAAQAYEFTFVGQVTQTNGSLQGVSVGTVFEGRFSGSSPEENYFYIDPTIGIYGIASYWFVTGQVTANIGGHTIHAGAPEVTVYNNLGGDAEDGIQLLGGYPIDIDGMRHVNGSFGFNLATRTGNMGVIQELRLPDQIDAAAFDAPSSVSYGSLQHDGATVLEFAVTSISVVPEPTSSGMLAVGALLVTALRRRREQPA